MPTPSLTRRHFLLAGTSLLAAPAFAAQRDAVAIGLFADSHYADRARRGSRHYRDSADKLTEFVRVMNQLEPAFIIVLGDYTDRAGDADQKARDAARMEAIAKTFRGPHHHVMGNHDLDVFTKDQCLAATGMPAPHYAFDAGPLRCIVLDANYRKDFSPYAAGNFNWKQTYIPPAEQKWLAAELQRTKRKAVVFVHQCLDDEHGAHGVKNAPDVRRILEASGKTIAVFQGHNHGGGARSIRGIPYLTLRAMVEGPGIENNAFALATLSTAGTVQLRGYGKQPNRKAAASTSS
jgi:alkaline phosphatase